MQQDRFDLVDYDECITPSQLCTNYNESMEIDQPKPVIVEEPKHSLTELAKQHPNPSPRTSDLMEDISSRPPALPTSLNYLMDWRNSNAENRSSTSSVGKISLESVKDSEMRLSLTQTEKEGKSHDPAKGNPFEQENNSTATQYTTLEGIAEVIGETDHEPEKKQLPKVEAASSETALGQAGKGCNCKKSRCLKLYCECFAAQKNCTKECNCVECHNTMEHGEDKQGALTRIMAKNPFSLLRRTVADSEPLIGCNCKKSSCQQNYCYCYKMGKHCNHLCKCVECENRVIPAPAPPTQWEGKKYLKVFTSHVCVDK